MIQKLQAKNLNGRTFEYELAPLVIITGNNTAGKSTIKDAVTLATLGSVPGYPATNAGIMDNFATGPNLAVAIKTVLGQFTRSWQRTGKTVKSDSAGDEAIAKALAPALFSGEQFIAAKTAHRANMLRAAFPTTADPKEAVRAAVTKAGGVPESGSVAGLAFDEWVEAYLAELAEEAKGHRANIKRMKGVIQGLTQLDAESAPVTVTKEELDAAREAVTKYAQKLGAAEQAVRAIIVPAEVVTPSRSVEIIKAELVKLEEQRAKVDASLRTGSQSYNLALSAHRSAVRVYDAAMGRHAEAVQEFEEAVKSGETVGVDSANFQAVILKTQGAADKLEELRRNAAITSELHAATMTKADIAEAKLAGLKTGVGDGCTCATCGAARDHWKAEYLKLAVEHIESVTKIRDSALEARQLAQEAASKAAEELEAALALMEERRAALAIKEASLVLDEHPAPQEMPVEPEAFDAEKLQGTLYDLETELSDGKDELEAWETVEQRRIKSEELAEAQQALGLMQKAHESAKQTAAEFQAAFDAGAASAESAAKQAAAEKELAEAEKALDANEATAALVKEQAAKESEKVLAPMLAVANTFTKGILSPSLSNVGLDIGRWHGTQWQPIARLSGAEKAMVVAALSAALSQAGNKLVIIDEFSVIDDAWKPLFLANLREAYVSGLIEQAIILDNRLVKSDGWENIELKA